MSYIRFLLDEHVSPALLTGLKARCPEMVVWKIGDPGAPPLGTKDPDILIWCERKRFILLTSNRSSMPVHLKDHLMAGQHIPGIFMLNRKLSLGEHIDDLEYAWSAAGRDGFKDIIWYLPLKR